MGQAQVIRDALTHVATLRINQEASAKLNDSVLKIKAIQTRRFECAYADMAADPRYAAATNFFLSKLYGNSDFTRRDAQFFKVAGALQRMLPHNVIETAVNLAKLHALTEELDQAMSLAVAGLTQAKSAVQNLDASNYILAWRAVGRREERNRQLQLVVALGHELVRLTNIRGLFVTLKIMHGPANAAGYGALQEVLEEGFDTFAKLNLRDPAAENFLSVVRTREGSFINSLFDDDYNKCLAELSKCLMGQH